MPLSTPATATDATAPEPSGQDRERSNATGSDDPEIPTLDPAGLDPMTDLPGSADTEATGSNRDRSPTGPPTPPQYPRIDPGEPPEEPDTSNERLRALLGTLGATLGAAAESPRLTAIGSGIAQGSATAASQAEKEYKERQAAYREFLTKARRFNRKMKAREEEARFEQQQSAYDRQQDALMDARLAQYEAQQDRKTDRARAKQRRELERMKERLDDFEEQTERIDATADLIDARRSDGAGVQAPGGDPLPTDPDRLRRMEEGIGAQIEALEAQKAEYQYQSTMSPGYRNLQERINGLRSRQAYIRDVRQRLERQRQPTDQEREAPEAQRSQGSAGSGFRPIPPLGPADGNGRSRDPNGSPPTGSQQRSRSDETFMDSQPPEPQRPDSGAEATGGSGRLPTSTEYTREIEAMANRQSVDAAAEKLMQDHKAGRISQAEAQNALRLLELKRQQRQR